MKLGLSLTVKHIVGEPARMRGLVAQLRGRHFRQWTALLLGRDPEPATRLDRGRERVNGYVREKVPRGLEAPLRQANVFPRQSYQGTIAADVVCSVASALKHRSYNDGLRVIRLHLG